MRYTSIWRDDAVVSSTTVPAHLAQSMPTKTSHRQGVGAALRRACGFFITRAMYSVVSQSLCKGRYRSGMEALAARRWAVLSYPSEA